MNFGVNAGAAVAGGIVMTAAATVAVGSFLWRQATARAVERLGGGTPSTRAHRFSLDTLAGLPKPVVRYFEFVLRPNQPLIRRARIEHVGEFRRSPDARWAPFHAVEYFSVDPPGFVWDAAIRMAPLLTVRVRDSYVTGVGAVRAKLASLITVADHRDRAELTMGALHRYLAEAVWLPSALLPDDNLTWTAVDDTTARATLTDGTTTVSLDVIFGEQGEVVRVSAMRYRMVHGTPVLTPWVGRFRHYARVDGMMIPMAGEVEWVLPEGPLPYWRGRVVGVAHEFAAPRPPQRAVYPPSTTSSLPVTNFDSSEAR